MMSDTSALWTNLQAEAELLASRDASLRPWLDALVLQHTSMHRAVVALVAEALGIDGELSERLADQLGAYAASQTSAIAFDLREARDRDQAATAFTSVLLFSKGFRGLAAYRLAHATWNDGDHTLARFIHYRATVALSIDIHPAALLAPGIVIDHGTGLVIGETAVVGSGSYLFHGVTLGSTGQGTGDRHPKLADDVFVGANATILGPVRVGKGSVIAAASVVTKDVPPGVIVGGAPARVLGDAKPLLPRRGV